MKLASIEIVSEILPHTNADSLEIAIVLGYQCIVPKGEFAVGRAVVLIQPDTVLPEKPWAEMFRKRSNRVKAIKLRDVWSFGIVLCPYKIDDLRDHLKGILIPERLGQDISHLLGVTKYEPPQPQDLSAAGYLPTGLPKTDEERYQNLINDLPYGKMVDVTLKIDGQSATYYCFRSQTETGENFWETGICSRSLRIKEDSVNNYTIIEKKYNILDKLKSYCERHNVSLAIRGEIYGKGVQAFSKNPHAKMDLGFAAFSVWNMDERRYEGPDDPHNYISVANSFDDPIPTVPLLEKTILTQELIDKYARDVVNIDGNPFEGVVIKYGKGSFKVINLSYDSNK